MAAQETLVTTIGLPRLMEDLMPSLKSTLVALNRLDDTIRDQHELYPGAVAEVLDWLCKLDEKMRRYEGSGYPKRRDAHPLGRVMLGLRFARDAHTHDLVSHVEQAAFTFGLTMIPMGMRYRSTWLPPSPEVRIKSQTANQVREREYYDKMLVGNSVRRSLCSVWTYIQFELGGRPPTDGAAGPVIGMVPVGTSPEEFLSWDTLPLKLNANPAKAS